MKYKKGDFITVKPYIADIPTVGPGMFKYQGKRARITCIEDSNTYFLCIDNGRYMWSEEMFA